MRSFSNTLLALAFLSIGLPIAPPAAHAQDEFEDEFDEDFEDEARQEEPPPRRGRGTGRGPAARQAEPDDFEEEADEEEAEESAGDEFGDEEEDAGGEEGEELPEDDFEDDDFEEEGEDRDRGAPAGRGRGGDLFRDRASDEWRDRRFVLHNSWAGPVGGIHVIDAGGGPSESFRAQLLTNFFFANGYLAPGDGYSHIGGSLSVSWSPWDFLEIYASLASYASSTNDPTQSPQLFQVLGDSLLGLKGYIELMPFFILGGDIGIGLLNTVGDIGLVGESTSVGIRLNATLDLRGLEQNIPFIARLNLRYYVDNSANLTNRVEAARYDALPTSGPGARMSMEDETRHLLTRFERTALGINRTDFFDIGIGFELPFTVMENFTISPIAEWSLNIPVNRQSYNCLYIATDFMSGRDDGCLDIQGFSAFPSTLTLGVRVMPPFRGLSITAAVDIGTSGMNTFVRELAANAPYDVILGFGYAFDAVPQVRLEERTVERRIVQRTPPPVRGRIVGTVVEQGAGTPIRGAVVSYVGHPDWSSQTTDASGIFRSYEVEPGELTVDITHPEYNAGRCVGTIDEDGGDTEVRCELVAMPRMGGVTGTVRSDTGTPVVGAQLTVTGPQPFSASTDAGGNFARQSLTPGTYTVRVEAEGYLITQETFEVRARETAQPQITVVTRPTRSLISVRAREIIIRRQVNFATDSADILPDSTALLSEIADALLRNRDIRRVEIQGHTDSNGDDAHNMDLSQRRADAVRLWLINAGVEADRLTAQGYGETRPLVPNITAGNRARNRRVQFIIQERD